MAVNTSGTTLKYALSCANQVDTATVVGTITTAGNATITVTGKAFGGTLTPISVAVAVNDTATMVATKIITGLRAVLDITRYYTVGGTGATVTLTRIVPSENDSTVNISIANGTCAGLTNAPTSVHTTLGGTFTKLCDITGYPDLGSSPSKLETTSLSDTTNKTNIMGLQELPDLAFEANYDVSVYSSIVALTAPNYYLQLDFGTDGKFNWQGGIKLYTLGGGVDEVRKMTIACSASTAMNFSMN